MKRQSSPQQGASAAGPSASAAGALEAAQPAGNAAATGELAGREPETPTPLLDAASQATGTGADTGGGPAVAGLGGPGDGATPMDSTGGAGAGITITSETAWAAADGSTAKDRTTIAAGETVYFTASDSGGSWTSTAGSGTDNGGIYNWTARGPGTVTITYTKGRQRATKTMRVIAPNGFNVVSTTDQSFTAGAQGAGMDVNLRVTPTTVAWGGIEVMEEVGTVAGTGYFRNRTIPHDPEPWAGVDETSQTGPDDASFRDWPSPWREGTMTWTIPTDWRLTGGASQGRFTTSTQAMTLHDTAGRSSVNKFNTPSSERTP